MEDQFSKGLVLGKLAPAEDNPIREAAGAKAEKILMVKLSSLGDVVQTLPVVHDILAVRAGAAVDWVVEEAFAPLVRRMAGVDRVLPMGERRWRQTRWKAETRLERSAFIELLQVRPYDAVIDFQGLMKSALVARRAVLSPRGFRATYANASEACGYEWPVRFMVDRAIPMARRIHAVARYRELAAAALGYDVDGPPVYGLQTRMSSRVASCGKTVVLAHGTTRPDNEWPVPRWVDLARQLAMLGYRIALPQSSDTELALCERIVDTLAHGVGAMADQVTVWPRMTLVEVLDAMSGVAGVIGVDSGLSHLAVALDLPHVQIFSQPRAWRAGPVGRNHQIAVGGMTAPDADMVWQAWLAVSRAVAPQC
jgi:heptosyltransferase I